MGKIGRVIEGVALAVVGVVTANPALIGSGIMMTIGAFLAHQPKPGSVDGTSETISLDPTAPRVFIFGNDVRAGSILQ